MVAGRAPFVGESSTDVLAAILDKEPLLLARSSPDVSPESQRIVTKCLRKERDERYQTMKDVLLDLKELSDELALEAKLERSIRPVSNVENQQTLISEAEITRGQSVQATCAASAQTASSADYKVSEIKNHKREFAIVMLALLVAAIGFAYWYLFLRVGSKQKDFQTREDLTFTRWGILYESLRDDPRYKDLLKRMNLPE
jgi:serine/threonine-protein kinase